MYFDSFNLHPRVSAGVKALGYEEPTPIQAQAIPHVLRGRDVMGLAQTGTGKTAAFALPILQHLLEGPRGRIRALVVAPTRELAQQINDAFGEMGARTGIRSAPVFGGVGANPQIRALDGRAEVIVACPGRLLDHLEQGTADLSMVEILVLDEADRMFDMGFLPDVRRIIKHLPAERQNLVFSATMPADIRRLVSEVLVDPATVEVDQDRPAATVAHAIYQVDERGKGEALLQLLYDTDTASVLVFTRTKHRAKRVSMSLVKAGFQAACLQGNLSQARRQEALDGFRSGKYQVLVATDIAARGIDVSTISHVINYDMPDTPDAYTHRIGRAGRAARTGDAFTLVTHADSAAVRAVERMMGSRIEQRRLGSRAIPDASGRVNAPAAAGKELARREPRNTNRTRAPRRHSESGGAPGLRAGDRRREGADAAPTARNGHHQHRDPVGRGSVPTTSPPGRNRRWHRRPATARAS